MICINKKCGAELPDDAIYCHRCGRKQIRESHPKKNANGMGTVYQRGDTFSAQVTIGWRKDKAGKRRRIYRTKGGFATKKEAREYLPILRHSSGVKAATLSSLYDGWSASAMLKLSSSKQCSYRIAYKRIEEIAFIDIDALTIADLQKCVDDNSSSYYTAKDIKNLLSHLYERACAQKNVGANLARFIELPELDEKETVPFTKEEQAVIWEDFSKGNTFAGYILLMLHTGMMPGELMKAKKSMIDWDNQIIVGCGLKTKKRKETPIALPDIILPVLDQLCSPKRERLFPYHNDVFYDLFNAYIALNDFNPELRPYSCRHTWATALDEAGVSPTVIQEIMRHSRFSTTERYIHKDMSSVLEELNSKIKKPTTDK